MQITLLPFQIRDITSLIFSSFRNLATLSEAFFTTNIIFIYFQLQKYYFQHKLENASISKKYSYKIPLRCY